MRTFKVSEKKKLCFDAYVICDDCGKECSNTNIEFKMKFSFSEDEHFKDICLDCWLNNYKAEWSNLKSKALDFSIQITKEENEKKKENQNTEITLHPLERKILMSLNNIPIEDLQKHTDLTDVEIKRAIQWLNEKVQNKK